MIIQGEKLSILIFLWQTHKYFFLYYNMQYVPMATFCLPEKNQLIKGAFHIAQII